MAFGEVDILIQAARWRDAGHAVALATVLGTRGSAPRPPGSHLAIRDDGLFAGSVSAGCVENIVIETARQVMADGRLRRLTFGPTPALAAPLEVGLTCGGEIEIVIEAFAAGMVDAIVTARAQGVAIVRALDLASGEQRLIVPGGTGALDDAARQAVDSLRNGIANSDGRDWMLTVYPPPRALVIVGAVHIAQALAPMAALAGYRVRIVDPRAYSASARFPDTSDIEICRHWPDEAVAQHPLARDSAMVALSHDAKLDDAALAAALRSPCGYIGALGSAQSHDRRLARLRAMGFGDTDLGRIHGPVGLSIGARGAGEIAIAILAELVAHERRPRIAGLVLAAGQSRRMGFNKLAAPVMGKPLARHAVETALAAGLDPVIVVTGHEAGRLKALLEGCAVTFVQNGDFARGLGASLAKGISAVPRDCAGAMVFLADMPGISPALAARLRAAFDAGDAKAIVAATAGGVRGHPVLWGRGHFAALAALDGDSGGKALMQDHASHVVEVVAQDAMPLADIDTLADLRRDIWQAGTGA